MSPVPYLVLSLFPGIALGEPEQLRRRHTAVEHGVVVRAQHPDVVGAGIASTARRSVPSHLVMKVDHD